MSDMNPGELRAYANSPGGWGQVGDASKHARYLKPVAPSSRRKCRCGCERRATHLGCVNGMGMMTGCEMSVRRWVREARS